MDGPEIGKLALIATTGLQEMAAFDLLPSVCFFCFACVLPAASCVFQLAVLCACSCVQHACLLCLLWFVRVFASVGARARACVRACVSA